MTSLPAISLPLPDALSQYMAPATNAASRSRPGVSTAASTNTPDGTTLAAAPSPAAAGQAAPDARAAAREAEIDRQIEAAKEFESVFVSMLIKEMRKGAEGLFPGDSTDSLGALFDMHIGREVADAGGLGIASQVTRYLEAQRT